VIKGFLFTLILIFLATAWIHNAQADEISCVVGQTQLATPGNLNQSLGALIADLFEISLSQRPETKILDRSSLRSIFSEKQNNDNDNFQFDSAQYILSLELHADSKATILTGRVLKVASRRVCSSFAESLTLNAIFEKIQSISNSLKFCSVNPSISSETLTQDEQEARSQEDKGISLYLLGEPVLAIAAFRNALAIDPFRIDSRFWLMKSYLLAKREKEAAIEARRFLAESGLDIRNEEVKALIN